MKKDAMVILVAGIAALVVSYASAQQGPQTQRFPQQQQGSQIQRQQGFQSQRSETGRRGFGREDRTRRSSDRDNSLGKDDQSLIEKIEETDSLSKLRSYLQQAQNSRSEEVRMAMIDALERADKHSASDFAYFLADSSKDVAEAAFTAWTSALEQDHGEDRIQAILDSAEVLRGYSGSRRQTSGQRSRSRQESGPMTQRSGLNREGQREEFTPGRRQTR